MKTEKVYINILLRMELLISLCYFLGCEREIDLNIPEVQPKIVIEGWIEQGLSAKVIITESVPYFSSLDSVTLMEVPVKEAKVTIITPIDQEILTLKPNTIFFPPFVYNTNEIKGEINQIYELIVEYHGKRITAHTTIPAPVELDSAWFELEAGYDSLGRIWIQMTDKPNQKDYYRIFTRRHGKDKRYIPSYISVFSDEIFSGGTIKLGLLRGSGSILDLGATGLFHIGDTVEVKFCTMNKEHFDFWESLQGEIITSANPFAASNARVKSNLSEGFGVWGGYGASYCTVVAE